MLAALAAMVLLASPAHGQEEGVTPAPPPGTPSGPDSSATEGPDAAGQPDAGSGRGVADHVSPAQDIPYPGNLTLNVDLKDVDRRVFNVHETLPVRSGRLTLLYPEWLPGNHAARGPIDSLAGLTISAAGRPLEWSRDGANVYAFHVVVPQGVKQLDLDFQFDSPMLHDQGRTVVTPDLLGLQWNAVVLYPAGYFATRVTVAAQVTLPEGWDFASALDVDSRRGSEVRFRPVTLETLVDSPLLTGRWFRSIDLDPGAKIPVHLNVVGDSPELLEVKPAQLAAHRRLVQETYALLGPPHYDRYEFLLALSDHFSDIGLEHYRSSENRRPPGYFLEWDRLAAGRDLLPHEFAHAWNGKYRRPAGLIVPNFNVPMNNSLLWVYEGLTNYLASVLAGRSGLWSEDFTRQAWASIAANMDRNRPGRAWRDLQDTTEQPIITARRPLSWLSWQRSEDYYTEGELLWLDVDTRIRELTGSRRSLDDFARAFIGAGTGPGPVGYTFADLVQALRAVAPFDWEKYLLERLHSHGPGAPLEGLARSGWRLVYGEQSSEYVRSLEDQRHAIDFTYSLGFAVGASSGQLTEVRWGGPAYDAALTIGTTLVAVNGREYRPDRLKAAIGAAKLNKQPIELLVKNLDRYRTVRIPYYAGLSYPQLQRIERTEDRLAAILKPRT